MREGAKKRANGPQDDLALPFSQTENGLPPTLALLHACEQLLARMNVKFAVNRLRVCFGGILAHAELTCDGRDGAAANEFGEHIAFPS